MFTRSALDDKQSPSDWAPHHVAANDVPFVAQTSRPGADDPIRPAYRLAPARLIPSSGKEFVGGGGGGGERNKSRARRPHGASASSRAPSRLVRRPRYVPPSTRTTPNELNLPGMQIGPIKARAGRDWLGVHLVVVVVGRLVLRDRRGRITCDDLVNEFGAQKWKYSAAEGA